MKADLAMIIVIYVEQMCKKGSLFIDVLYELYGSFKVGGLGCINVWFDCNCVATRQKKYDFVHIYDCSSVL